jgi:hypothetical protein
VQLLVGDNYEYIFCADAKYNCDVYCTKSQQMHIVYSLMHRRGKYKVN